MSFAFALYIFCLGAELALSIDVFPEFQIFRIIIFFIGIMAGYKKNQAIVTIVNAIVILGSLAVMRENVLRKEVQLYESEKEKLQVQLLPTEKKNFKSSCNSSDPEKQTSCLQNERYVQYLENIQFAKNIESNKEIHAQIKALKVEVELFDFPSLWLSLLFSVSIPICAHYASKDLPNDEVLEISPSPSLQRGEEGVVASPEILESSIEVKTGLKPVSTDTIEEIPKALTIETYDKILFEKRSGATFISLAEKYGFKDRHALSRAMKALKRSAAYFVTHEERKATQRARIRAQDSARLEENRAQDAQSVRIDAQKFFDNAQNSVSDALKPYFENDTRAEGAHPCADDAQTPDNSNILQFERKKGA